MDASIVTRELTKRYPRTAIPALDKLTITIPAGEVYGFLGANGAGKSTTIRTLLNFIQPTGGSATILGCDIVRDSVKVKRHVGYLAGEIALPRKATGREFLAYMSELQPPKHTGFLSELAHRFEAELDKPLSTLSKGNRQKIGLLQAFMHEPEVLILDEPTSGLDPLMQEEFFRLVRESKDRGAAVFVSSHNFAEVQRMCDRIGLLRAGKLVAEQMLADLENKASHTFILTFKDQVPVLELKKLKHLHLTSHDDHRVTLQIEGELTPLFAVLARHHVTGLEKQEVNLEEEFLRFYSGDAHA